MQLREVESTVVISPGYIILIACVTVGLWIPLSLFPAFRSVKAFGWLGSSVAIVVGAFLLLPGQLPSYAADFRLSGRPASRPAPTTAEAAVDEAPEHRGDSYLDGRNGYSLYFPEGWTHEAIAKGDPWILDARGEDGGLISVGFSKMMPGITIDQLQPDVISKGLKTKLAMSVQATGYGLIDGRKCLWHKYTGNLTFSKTTVRMTAVHYLLPLGDGRALELRLAATPEQFNKLAPVMKESVESFKLLPRR